MSLFKPVSPKLNVQGLEAEQSAFWKEKDVIARTYTERAGKPSYVFYEGPPTANGRPGSHHVLARAFKDMFPRYKVMRGYQILRKGGWDTHGLPVEVEVEKELGIKQKHEIEEYGIAAFNQKCRDSVFRYMQEWEKLTERIGYWVDLKNAYVTYHNDYIEAEWWLLRQMWDKGLLYRGYKVVPYCAHCGTPLSTHELAQGYADVTDPSVYVRFPLIDEPGTSLLAWTTTPWTLPGNVALAVNQSATYAIVEGETADGKTERLILAEALIEHALQHPEQYKVVGTVTGADLINKKYQPPYDDMQSVQADKRRSYVVHGDFVGLEDGTGIVHIAPAFGADDLEIGQLYDLPVLRTVGPDGMFVADVKLVAGLWFKDADLPIIKDLKARGVLFRQQRYEHSYPFCWRCKNPLMYYARNTWFIATTRYRDQLVALNNTIHWEPEHIQQGRFGNWLAENRDWALGRERYWGTPLPVWVCDNPDCGHMHCVSSVAELSELSGSDQTSLDLHRPYVDNVTWRCTTCNTGTMKRQVEVIDVWFDSGAMPIAQWGYPAHNTEMFGTQFPADYICEAIDQTRGWFYSLHAIATLAFGSVAYKNVICLGHILDENGEKMSKSKGNIVEPWPVLEKYGADAFRWYLYTASAPGDSRRFSVELVGDVIRNFTLTLWNTYSFYVTYANIDNFDPTKAHVPIAERDELDRWVLSELYRLVQRVTEAYESYNVTDATRPIQVFVDDLSNWYLRRSRRRFWKSDNDTDKAAAHLTLYECLLTVSKLLAPAMPFLADAMYRNLAALDPSAPESVHLAHWPTVDDALIDQQLVDGMALIKKLAELGRSAREGVNIKLRQPLAEGAFAVRNPAEAASFAKLDYLLADELNLKHVHLLESAGGVVAYTVHPLPSKLGKRLGQDWPRLQKVVREADSAQAGIWARQLIDRKPISINYEGSDGVFKSADLAPEEVEIRQSASTGYAIAEEGGYLVALTTELTEALIAEGLAREVVRRVQVMRRDADFALDDRIALTYQASDRLSRALGDYADYLRSETLADKIAVGTPTDGQSFTFEDGDTITLAVERLANGHA